MSDPQEPEAGNLFLAVATSDGKVHSTTLQAASGTWSPFDEVSSPARQGGRAVGVSVNRHRQVVTLDDSLARQARFFQEEKGAWVGRFLGVGMAPVSADGSAGLAVVGATAPTVAGFSFGLPLLLQNGAGFLAEGDQLAGVAVGDIAAGDVAVSLDAAGSFGPNEWTFDLCLATAFGGIYYARKAVYHGAPVGPTPRFTDVATLAGALGPVVAVSCSANQDGLHVGALDATGKIWHTLRRSDGTWTPWVDVNAATGTTVRIFARFAVSAYNGDFDAAPVLHLAVVDDPGGIWHAVRASDGTWSPLKDVKAKAGDPGFPVSLDAGATPWLIH